MKLNTMRSAMAMIELIFAIVIIAISVISIPTMISVADKASEQITVDDDVMSRLSGWTIDKFQARWDGNYSASGSGPLIMNPNTGDLHCVARIVGSTILYRENNDSTVQCNIAGNPSAIPPSGDGNLTKGIEQLNHGNSGNGETIEITPSGGTPYSITATYEVRYVESGLTGVAGNTATATWVLGSSADMAPDDGLLNPPTHLKRVVTRFNDTALGVDTTLTFFKSNKGN